MATIDLGALQTGNVDLGALQSAGSGALTLSISDSFSFSDPAISTILTPVLLTLSINDTLIFSDSINEILLPIVLTQTFSDTFTFFDSVIEQVEFPSLDLIVSDSFQFFDLLTTSKVDALFLTDFFFFYKENLAEIIDGAPVATSDFFTFNDKLQQALAGLVSYEDSLVFSDSVIAVLNSEGTNLTDSFSFTDSPVETSLSMQLTLQLSDALSFSDSMSQTPSTDFTSYIRRYLNDVP
jgi:hypothetical protein